MARQPDRDPVALARTGALGELEVTLQHLRDAVHASVTQGTSSGEDRQTGGESLSMPPSCTKRWASPMGQNPSTSSQR